MEGVVTVIHVTTMTVSYRKYVIASYAKQKQLRVVRKGTAKYSRIISMAGKNKN